MNNIITNFTRGELSPLLHGRNDLEAYYKGAEELENFIVLPTGGIVRRPGFRVIEETKTSSKDSRLIPFQFSTIQGYILEFGDEYIRFYYKDAGRIVDGASAYEIASPYGEDDLSELQYAQDADVMWICHPDYKPRKLSRTGHTSWTLVNYAPTADPFGADGSDDCPRAVTIYQKRLYFAGTDNAPQTIWGTKVGDYEDMTTGSNDDDALEFTIGSSQVNVIRWLSSSDKIAAGTMGGIFTFSGGVNEPITPSSISAKKDTSYGTVSTRPESVGSFIYYVQSNNKILREFKYSFEQAKNVAHEASVLSEHLLDAEILEMAYQQTPFNIVWCVMGDGTISALTRQEEHEVAGWSLITTDGDVKSAAVISGDGEDDELWIIVERTIDGSAKKYVERLTDFSFDYIEDAVRVDSAILRDNPITISSISSGTVTANNHGLANEDTVLLRKVDANVDYHKYTVANASTNQFDIDSTISATSGEAYECTDAISGLGHLEGEEISILADGAVHPDVTVANGSANLEWEAGLIHAGMPYKSRLKTLRVDAPVGGGSTLQGLKKKIYEIMIRFYETVGCSLGDVDTQDDIVFREVEYEPDMQIPLFTGTKTVTFPSRIDHDAHVVVETEEPLPLTITSIIRKIGVFGGNK